MRYSQVPFALFGYIGLIIFLMAIGPQAHYNMTAAWLAMGAVVLCVIISALQNKQRRKP